MGYHLRYQSKPWATHHVVSRCVNGYSFLKPTSDVVKVTVGVLGRALNVYSHCIKLHHNVFLSNHFHLLLSSESTDALSEFMKYLKSNLARELSRIHGWHGPMWQSRYSSEEILDEDGLVEVFKYITENSVKEGLVDDPGAWEGLHGYHQLVNQRVMSGPWLDRTGLYKAKQNPQTRSQAIPENFTTVYSVNLTPPPLWEEMSEEEYHLHCVKLSEEAIKSAQMKREGASMGMARVLAEDVYKPRRVKHGQRPLCRTKCIELLKAYQTKYFSFKSMFEVAYQQLRDALLSGSSYLGVIFPSEGVSPLGGRSLIQLE